MHKDKNERIALSVSILLHIIVFACLAATGLFVYLAASTNEHVLDVEVYDSDAGGKSTGGSGGENLLAGTPVIEVKEDVHVPIISEQYTKEARQVQKQEEQQEQQGREESKATPEKVANGIAFGNGGSGSGKESNGFGSGVDNGIGNGTENGSGDGSGRSGKNSGDTLKPKIAPQLLSSVQPGYPERLRRDGIEGQVVVKMVVGTDGSVERVSVVGSSGHGEMDKAAEEAAYRYSFTPAENAYGEAVRCAVRQTISFSLH